MTRMSFVLRSTWLLPLLLIGSVLYIVIAVCAIVIGLVHEQITSAPTAARRSYLSRTARAQH